ncbi:MAG TPA: hypothetical protein VH915_11385, partial [Pedococcus sp.]
MNLRERLRPSRWRLSTKLVASMIALFIAVTLATASLTVVLLHNFLMTQLDRDVRASAMRIEPHQRDDDGPAPE